MRFCVICKEKQGKVIFNDNGINILRCQNCKHAYSQYEREQDYDGYFQSGIGDRDNFWWDEAHKEMYNDFCKKYIAGKSGSLLDVGCGLGFFVKKIRGFKSWESYGYEISTSAVEYAKEKFNSQNIFCGRVEESNFSKNYFDIITLWDVIEHIPDPHQLLNYLRTILKENGILFIHTPNIGVQLPKARFKRFFLEENEPHLLEAKDHLNIYSPQTIKILLKQCGFGRQNFIHFRPIQSVSGNKSQLLRMIKNLWYYLAVFIFYISFQRINLDNLFIEAKK